VWRLINAMEQSDRVTDAMTHAYVASNVVASAEAEMTAGNLLDPAGLVC
jgi:hypothetical protein